MTKTIKSKFVTIFKELKNVHLIKDVGQIPYFMYRTQGYDSTIVCYRNETDYPYISKEVQGLKIEFLNDSGQVFASEKAILWYLFSNARKIDVLHLFHFKKRNLLYLLFYKLLNAKGKAYLKFDIDLQSFQEHDTWFHSRYTLKNHLLNFVTKLQFWLVDLFSVETTDGVKILLQVYPELQNKLICIPNGVDDIYIEENIKLKSFAEKEKLILTVGRIGTFQKNTELFMESLANIDLKDWKVIVIGPIEESFHPYIKDYFVKYPYLVNRVVFAGNISDRKAIYDFYNRASIFCLTSRVEGFPIAFAEALYFGNFIITTPVAGSKDITSHECFGRIVEDNVTSLGNALEICMSGNLLNERLFISMREYAKANYTWSSIIRKISCALKQKIDA